MADRDPFDDPHGPSGHWSGYYEHDTPTQSGRRFPIHATIRVDGGRVSGEMVDGVTDFAYSLGKILDNARQAGLTPAPLFEAMVDRYPDAIIRSSLPSCSTLRGRLRGDRLTFTKTYEGPESARYEAGGRVLATRHRPRHEVHYSGRFDVMSDVIVGSWEIFREPFGRLRPRLATGSFWLGRVRDGDDPRKA